MCWEIIQVSQVEVYKLVTVSAGCVWLDYKRRQNYSQDRSPIDVERLRAGEAP